MNLVRASILHNVSKAKAGGEDSSQTIVPMESRTCPAGLEKREAGSFRNLTGLYIPCMLARRGSTVRQEEMEGVG